MEKHEELPFDIQVQISSVSVSEQDFNMRVAAALRYQKLFNNKNATTICSCPDCIKPVAKPDFKEM